MRCTSCGEYVVRPTFQEVRAHKCYICIGKEDEK